MVLLKNFINVFSIPELRKKLLFTLGILVIYRLGGHIPVIGVDVNRLDQLMHEARGLGGIFAYMDVFSGGFMQKATLFALGIFPYITASIMMQMFGMTIPALEKLLNEGEWGRKQVNQYTRYLAFLTSIVQSITYAFLLEKNNLVIAPGWGFRIIFVFSLSVAAMFVMWLGEQISLFGLGNGSSMLIFAGIVTRITDDVFLTVHKVQEGFMDPLIALLIFASFIIMAACVVFVERGERKISVQYTRRVVGQRIYNAQSTYIPFKVNNANVMPAILASTVLQILMLALTTLAAQFSFFKGFVESFSVGGIIFSALQTVLIIFFSFVYTAMIFDPNKLAEDMKKSGGFIPGIRPGRKTAEFFNFVLTRLGLIGALYLSILALLPTLMHAVVQMPFTLPGTSLLIVVGVGLETAAQIESYLIENRYDGFLSSGRLKGRYIR